MKIILVILFTFLIAFLTSSLLEIDFIKTQPVRYVLVIMLIVIEILTGYFYVKSEIK